MRRFASCLLLAACAWAAPATGAEDFTPEKEADLRRLVTASGVTGLSGEIAEMLTRPLYTALRQARPDLPERALPVINRELRAFFDERLDTPGGLLDRVVSIYHQRFTHAEVKELLAFYQSPLGRKTLEVLPAVSAESTTWARSLAPEIRRRVDAALAKEGLQPPPRN